MDCDQKKPHVRLQLNLDDTPLDRTVQASSASLSPPTAPPHRPPFYNVMSSHCCRAWYRSLPRSLSFVAG